MIRSISRRRRNLQHAYSTLTKETDKWNSLISRTNRDEDDWLNDIDVPLSGTTFIAKDNIATKKGLTTAASKMLSNYHSPFNATVIDLLVQSGSTLIGKSNMDEFGMGSSTTNSYYGPTINPHNFSENRIAGGSSGGSAAAIAAGLASFSLGTDTGGSIRLPASHCHVIGFKPTYGRISRWGVVPYAQTLDTVGIIADKIETVENVYKVLDRYDEKDPTSMTPEVRSQIKPTSEDKLVIGIPEELVLDGLDQWARSYWKYYISQLGLQGYTVRHVSIPSIKKSLSTYYTLATAEAASNLSRYDGVRYGFSKEEVQPTAFDSISLNRSDSLGEEVQRRILLGNYTLSSSSGDHYLRATKIREELVNEFNDVFNMHHVLLENNDLPKENKCDVLMYPTSLVGPPKIDAVNHNHKNTFLNSYLNDILTVPSSLAGLPSISVPMNQGQGIQFIGQYGDDETVFKAARTMLKCVNENIEI